MKLTGLKLSEKNLAIEYIRKARSDLESSKELFSKGKDYSNACFLLQQSLEKTIKATLLVIGCVKPSEFKRIGHVPVEWLVLRNCEVLKDSRKIKIIQKSLETLFEKFRKTLCKHGMHCDIFFSELKNRVNSFLAKLHEYTSLLNEFVSKYRQLKRNKLSAVKYLFNEIDEYKRKEIERFFIILNKFSNLYDSLAYGLSSNMLELFETKCVINVDNNNEQLIYRDLVKQMKKECYTLLTVLKYVILVSYLHLLFEITGSTIRYPETIDEKTISPNVLSRNSYIVVWCEKTVEFIERGKIFEQLETILRSF